MTHDILRYGCSAQTQGCFEATLEARIVSLPLPPTAVSTTVPKAMAMLLVRPPALEKVPGVRSTVAFAAKPERSRVLPVPWFQIVKFFNGSCDV